MNIPSIESLYATIEQQQRVIKQAHEDIAAFKSSLENSKIIVGQLTSENINLLDAQSRSLQTISKLTHERDAALRVTFDPAVLEKMNAMESALREAKEALVMNIVGTSGRTPAAHNAIAAINKVLGEG